MTTLDVLALPLFSRALVERLTAEQYQLDWTDTQMAEAIGIRRVYWNLLKNRRARPGRKVVDGAYAAFPGLCEAAERDALWEWQQERRAG